LPYIQVATFLNVSLSTVKSRMFRNRQLLREGISMGKNPFG
jgi:DNA-directed RNA polymerase specialized sigma24 family protein